MPQSVGEFGFHQNSASVDHQLGGCQFHRYAARTCILKLCTPRVGEQAQGHHPDTSKESGIVWTVCPGVQAWAQTWSSWPSIHRMGLPSKGSVVIIKSDLDLWGPGKKWSHLASAGWSDSAATVFSVALQGNETNDINRHSFFLTIYFYVFIYLKIMLSIFIFGWVFVAVSAFL